MREIREGGDAATGKERRRETRRLEGSGGPETEGEKGSKLPDTKFLATNQRGDN